MPRLIKFTTITLLFSMLVACSTSVKRANFDQADQVGAVDMGMLTGTWKIKVINPRETDPPMDAEFIVAADGSFTGYSAADFKKNEFGRVVYDVSGVWVVEGDTVLQTMNSVKQTSGSPLAALGVGMNLGLLQGQTKVFEVYEATADHLVLVTQLDNVVEKGTIARHFSRVK